MIIGNFTYDAEADSYTGDVATFTSCRGTIQIEPNEKSGGKEPDYRLTARTPCGRIELGAAWKRTSERGQEFLSVSIDDPMLTAAVNAALFLDAESEKATLVWRRKKADGQVDADDQAATVPSKKKARAKAA